MATTQVKNGFQGGTDDQLKVNTDGSINVNVSGGGGSPVSTNITEIGGSPISLGQTTESNSLPVTIASNQSSIPVSATQSGTWNINALTSITNPVAVTQSGTWSVGRTWDLSSSTDSVAAVQSGIWNIASVGSITNPIAVSSLPSIPAGTNAIGSVSVSNFPSTQPISGTVAVSNFPATQPVSGTIAATQSGTWNLNNITGTISLPTGAATNAELVTINTTLGTPFQAGGSIGNTSFGATQANAANLNATVVGAGTAGTPSGGVLTVQGNPSGTPIPISGSITATNLSIGPTGSTPPADATYIGALPSASSPSLTAGQLNPLSLNLSGAVRVDGSSTTQPVSGSVSVSNFPATQPVSGTIAVSSLPSIPAGTNTIGSVSVSNFPATQPVSGTLAVSNFPATQPVSGTVTVSSLPSIPAGTNAIGSVSVSNFPSTQPVSGSVSVSNFPATQPVSGTVTANAGTGTFAVSAASLPLPTGAATNSELVTINTTLGSPFQAGGSIGNTAFGISGSLPAGANAIGSVSVSNFPSTQPISGTVAVSNFPATQPVSGTLAVSSLPSIPAGTNAIGSVSVSNFPATQPVSGTLAVTQNTSPWVTKDASDGPVTPGSAASNSSLMGGQYNSTLPTLTNTQQSALQVDSSGRLIVSPVPTSAQSSGTISALNGTAVIQSAGYGTIYIDITGTWVGTLQTQAQNGDGNWNPVFGVISSTGLYGNTITANSAILLNCAGFYQVRVIATAWTSGTATVSWNTAPGTKLLQVYQVGSPANLLTNSYTLDGSGNSIASYNSQLDTADIINNALSSGSITVGTTAVAARVSSSNLANRKMLMISPLTQTTYLGSSSSVTTGTGIPIYPGQTVSFSFSANVTPYLISSVSGTVNIFEAS